ncbi:class I SAM-dependent methyltransferase [Prosthecobacter sp.]|uniref:class I SAM-dependent methyltransferase n=1 Tax=Prosthecobacter sp. TaxID=1965333 RepID=UPI002489D4FA|nr:class I SAM-dependent methyltransferase [Prosthecobacter sp.]MDI1313104.1 methyltransferase domain-containing protein [Prosthecobacter sp.]
MSAANVDTSRRSGTALERYYQFHSRIYDATRWSFLFGREEVLRRTACVTYPRRILEVGCGTGRNLPGLRRLFPHAHITGVDLSEQMLAIAAKKVSDDKTTLLRRSYSAAVHEDGQPYDLVLFSYALSMFNPGWEQAINAAWDDLAEGGCIAVVDFSDSYFTWFRNWMGVNHVRMEGHLWPYLSRKFAPLLDERFSAYGGVWNYGIFIGRKQA